MKATKQKAFAYITHSHHLLVFRHPYVPEAGIQVPAGTVEENERPEEAVLREAFEETGLSSLVLHRFLGKQERDMSDFGREEIHQRFFYHLQCTDNPLPHWCHEERFRSTDSDSVPIIFEFFWASLPNAIPPLIADHGIMLPQLLEVMSLKEN